jgi:Na+-transporting methylmalonyl-CoA/oxaloacetate decarboxylase beta subunit
MKKLLLIFVVVCAVGAAILLALRPSDASIGVIGGADGPTAIFIGGDPVGLIAVAAIVICLAAVAVLLIRRKRG